MSLAFLVAASILFQLVFSIEMPDMCDSIWTNMRPVGAKPCVLSLFLVCFSSLFLA